MNICKIPVKSTTWTKGWDAKMFLQKFFKFLLTSELFDGSFGCSQFASAAESFIFFWTPTASRINSCKLMKKMQINWRGGESMKYD